MPQASIGHLLNMLDQIVLDQQLNNVQKIQIIPVLTKSISELIQADKASSQAGLSPEQQMQIEQSKLQLEQQKADREHGLKLVEMQHKMALDKQAQEHKAALEAMSTTAQTANSAAESQANIDQMQKQSEMAIREQNHAEMMAHREQDFAEKLAKDKADPTAGQDVT